MTLFKLLQEAKDHIIKKLPNLQDKERIIKFFKENPAAESKIDWNVKDILTDEYFEEFMKEYNRNNKTQMKKNMKKGIIHSKFVEGKDYYDFSDPNEDYYLFMPKYHSFQVYIQNLGPTQYNAKWCIGDQNNNDYWDNYAYDEFKFIIAISKDFKLKLAYQFNKIHDNSFTSDLIKIWSINDYPFDEDEIPFLESFWYYNNEEKRINEMYNIYKSLGLDKTLLDFEDFLDEHDSDVIEASDDVCDDNEHPREEEINFAHEITEKIKKIWENLKKEKKV